MEVHKYARQRASRRPGSNGCVIMRGRRAQSPETIIVCARVHLGVWLCDRPAATGTGHRAPPAAMRPWRMGVAATCRCTAPGRRAPSSATVASRPASQFGRLRRPRSVNQSCKACKHETRIAICNLVVRIPNRIVSLSAHASCLIVVPPLSSKRVVVSRTRGVAPMAASVTCTNMHITSSCAKPHASLPRHMSHVQLSIAHFYAPLASALISPAPPYL